MLPYDDLANIPCWWVTPAWHVRVGWTFIDRATAWLGVGRTNSRVGREKQATVLMNSRWVIHRLLRVIHVRQCVLAVLNGVPRCDNGGLARQFNYSTKIIIQNLNHCECHFKYLSFLTIIWITAIRGYNTYPHIDIEILFPCRTRCSDYNRSLFRGWE